MFVILNLQWHQPFLLWDCHGKTIPKLLLMITTIFNTTAMGKMKGGATCYTNVLAFFFPIVQESIWHKL